MTELTPSLVDPAKSTDYAKGLLVTLSGVLLFTFDVPILRLAATDSWTLSVYRGALLFIAFTATWLVLGRKHAFIGGAAGLAVAATNTVSNLLFVGAVNHTAAANLVLILALNPIICAVLAAVFLKERIHPRTILALILSGIGVSVIAWDDFKAGQILGDLMALGVVLCTAIALTIIRRSKENLINSFALGGLLSAVIALPFAPSLSLDPDKLFWITMSGLIVMPIGMALIAMGPRLIPTPDVAMFYLLETFLTPVWVWLLFDETPTTAVFLGGAIILVTLIAHSVFRLNGRMVSSAENGAGQVRDRAATP